MRELTEEEVDMVSGARWHHYQARPVAAQAAYPTQRIDPSITDPYVIAYIEFHALRTDGLSSSLVA